MRLFLGSSCAVLLWIAGVPAGFAAEAGSASLPAGRHPLLDQAFNAFLEHQGRWAYTERFYWLSFDGKKSPETIVRVDPSLSYAQQYTLVQLAGKPPPEKLIKQWAERGEKEARRRQKIAEDELTPTYRKEEFQMQIYNEKVTPLLEEAVVVAEDETSVTYEIPMRKAGGLSQPRYEKYRLTARVSKRLHQFEQATLRQREPFHIVAGKYSDGLNQIEFGSPDARFPTVQVKTISQITNKPLFGPAVRSQNVTERTELRHVTPYDERFGVKIGPMRTIEF